MKKKQKKNTPKMAPSIEWERFKETQNPQIRAKILSEYLPLVKNVAGRMAAGFPKSVELNDLVNTGVIGLIEAFNNFDPGRGVKFETFAVPRIRGAILDELRALDWVPRSTRAKARNIDKAITKLEAELDRSWTSAELAETLNITHDELRHAIKDISITTLLSLDELICREDDNRQVPGIETIENSTTVDVLDDMEKTELRVFLIHAINNYLSISERITVGLYYYEESSINEIAQVLFISESEVSNILTKAIDSLRKLIKDKFAISFKTQEIPKTPSNNVISNSKSNKAVAQNIDMEKLGNILRQSEDLLKSYNSLRRNLDLIKKSAEIGNSRKNEPSKEK